MEHREIARLVKKASKGDNEAFAALYEELFDGLYYRALKTTKSPDDAADVVQDTMVDIYRNLDKLKNERAFVSYVNRMVYGKSVDVLRAKKRWDTTDELQLLQVEETNDDFIPEEYLETQEKRQIVLEAIDALSDNLRVIVLLYYYEQLTTPEIASSLQLGEAAVRTRLSRARSALKRSLMGYEEKNRKIGIPVFILGRIISADAEASSAPAVKTALWEGICKETGIPVTTNAASSASSSSSAASSSAAGASTVAKIAIGTALVAAVATGAIFIISGGDENSAPISPFEPSAVVSMPIDEHPTTSGDISNPDDNIIIPLPSDNDGTGGQKDPTPPPDTSEDPNIPDAAPSPSSNSDPGNITNPSPNPDVTVEPSGQPSFAISSSTLSYPIGAELTESQILSDAGAIVMNTDLVLEVLALDMVDTQTAGVYYIYITLDTEDVLGAWQRVVTVVIEEVTP